MVSFPEGFLQGLFEACLEKHPEFEKHRAALADVVESVACEAEGMARQVVVEGAVEALSLFYAKTRKKRRLPRGAAARLRKDPASVHRAAVDAVEETSLSILGSLADVTDLELLDTAGNA